LGNTYYVLRDKETALKYFEKSVELEPTNTVWLNYLGSILTELERHDKANRYLD